MTMTVHVAVTSHVVVAGDCNFLPPSILYIICLLQASQLNVVPSMIE